MNWDRLLNGNRLRSSKRLDQNTSGRNDFESDFGRIIFCPAIRRLHDKTQVFPLSTDDNIHTRLTHSMEVMSVGYSIGVKICETAEFQKRLNKDIYSLFREIPVIIKNSCLVHDIGNPPFGHFGETIIKNYFNDFFRKDEYRLNLSEDEKKDFLCFDGNAQGFRVLTKLQFLNDEYGLNLTYATLAAYLKYPNLSEPSTGEEKIELHKKGVFYSEKDHFEKVVQACDLKLSERTLRHPLSYIMEAADTICYSIMDIEDAYNKNLIDVDYLYKNLKKVASIKNDIEEIYTDKENYYKNDNTKMANFRILIIQKLVELAKNNFIKNIDAIENGTYNQELINDDENKLIDRLQHICKEKIFTLRDINSLEITGHSVITGLLDSYIKFIFHNERACRKRAFALISKTIIKTALEENKCNQGNNLFEKFDCLSGYYKLKVIVDFISGMTDQYALNHYQKISGQKIN